MTPRDDRFARSVRRLCGLSLAVLALAACPSAPPEADSPPESNQVGTPVDGSTEGSVEAALDPQVVRAIAVNDRIVERPEGAAAVLEEQGMTIEQFEALMMVIAADPELSAQFRANSDRQDPE